MGATYPNLKHDWRRDLSSRIGMLASVRLHQPVEEKRKQRN